MTLSALAISLHLGTRVAKTGKVGPRSVYMFVSVVAFISGYAHIVHDNCRNISKPEILPVVVIFPVNIHA